MPVPETEKEDTDVTTRNSLAKAIPILATMLAGLALLAPAGRTQDFSKNCGDTMHLMADGRIVEGRLGNNAGDHLVWFRFSTRPGVSYSIEAHMPVQPASATPTVEVFNVGDVDFFVQCQTGPSTVTTRNTTAIAPIIRHNGMRVSLAGTGADLLVRVSGFLGQVLSMQLSETTLFDPRWSTFGGFHTEFGFRNTTNATINGTLTLLNDDGTVNTTSSFAIPANGTVFRDTRAAALIGPTGLEVPNDSKGSAQFTHDGPPAAVVADAFIVHPGFPSGPFVVPASSKLPASMPTKRALGTASPTTPRTALRGS